MRKGPYISVFYFYISALAKHEWIEESLPKIQTKLTFHEEEKDVK